MEVLEILSTIGPGRRANVSLVEMVLLAEADEESHFEQMAAELQRSLPQKLAELKLAVDHRLWAQVRQRATAIAQLAGHVCNIALALQNAAGHKLEFEGFLQDQDPQTNRTRYRLMFQHDDVPGGEQAGDLAMCIASELCPRLHWQALLHDENLPLAHHVAAYIKSARLFVTPAETLGLIAAAQARGIPSLRLEREPYGPLPASFRIAPNGMLMLGHGRNRLVLDGLYCIDRPGPGFQIMRDRRALWALLTQLGISGPVVDPNLMLVASSMRARRAARRLGFPLRIRPLQRNPAAGDGWLADSESALEQFLASIPGNFPFLFEPVLKGKLLELLFANGNLLLARQDHQACAVPEQAMTLCQQICRAINSGLLLVRLQPSSLASDAHFAVTDLDPAPALEQWLAAEPEVLAAAYSGLLDWLFPPGSASRIPIVSVTGTNGKTTTCTLISALAEAEGHCVGVARTTGVTIGKETREIGDLSGFLGHCMVLDNKQVDFAVLETARGDVLRSGFAFDQSDVAICTNVTAEHLGEHGIETVEEMAVIKRLILVRSKGAVALNADDALCMDMLPWLSGRTIFLTTLVRSPADLRNAAPAGIKVVHIDEWQGEDWIMFDDQGSRTPVIAVNDVPATFNGLASHNVSNVLHAVSAALALGFGLENIRQTLSAFSMSFEVLPGRLNMHHNGQIQIIMDYAHNADGIRQLAIFTDQLHCAGRRILRFAVSPKATVAAAFRAGSAAAGHFDHYICSDMPRKTYFDSSPQIEGLRQGLLANGVPQENIEVFTDPNRSVEYPVSLCQPGDLLVLVTSTATFASTWEKILQTGQTPGT